MVIVAAPEYLERFGSPASLTELGQHVCLHQRSLMTGRAARWPLQESSGGAAAELPVTLAASAVEALIDLALNGLGLACVPLFTVQDHIAAKRLFPVLGDAIINSVTLRLVWPSNRHLSPKIRAFVEHMSASVQIGALLGPDTMRDAIAPQRVLEAQRHVPRVTYQNSFDPSAQVIA